MGGVFCGRLQPRPNSSLLTVSLIMWFWGPFHGRSKQHISPPLSFRLVTWLGLINKVRQEWQWTGSEPRPQETSYVSACSLKPGLLSQEEPPLIAAAFSAEVTEQTHQSRTEPKAQGGAKPAIPILETSRSLPSQDLPTPANPQVCAW